MNDDFEWNDAAVARLRVLWGEGLSTAEIGRRLGTSKNSVVGKVHRLDLPARPSPIRPAGLGRRKSKHSRGIMHRVVPSLPSFASTPVVRRVFTAPAREPTPVRYISPSAVCQFPIGHPRERGFRFCEEPAMAGSYCLYHYGLCVSASRREGVAA